MKKINPLSHWAVGGKNPYYEGGAHEKKESKKQERSEHKHVKTEALEKMKKPRLHYGSVNFTAGHPSYKKAKHHVGGSFAEHIDEMKNKGLRYM